MSPWLVASLILMVVLLLFSPIKPTFLSSAPPANLQVSALNSSPAPLPITQGQPLPIISAKNVFITDMSSKTVLWQKDADAKVLPASTTKMMTALVVLEHFGLTDEITVTTAYPAGTVVGFKPGEKLTVEQLLYALLVQSANDAAEILAENYPEGRTAFVAAMNAKASQIHLTNTHFVNPTGIDEEGHYSSASDLARLADVALRNAEFSKIVATENAVISSHVITNVNQLLGKIPGVIGIKTGYTEGAGQALVTLVNRDNHPVILVVLGSVDRFGETATLIGWVYSNFRWEPLGPTPQTPSQ